MNFLLVKSTCHQQDDKCFIEYATSSRLVLYTMCAYAAARLVSYAVLYATDVQREGSKTVIRLRKLIGN